MVSWKICPKSSCWKLNCQKSAPTQKRRAFAWRTTGSFPLTNTFAVSLKSVWYWNRVYVMKENLLWFTEISGGRASCWKYNWRKRETLSLHARRVVQRNLAAKRKSHSAQSRRNISHESICTFQLRNFRLYMYKRQKE